ncbi:hypothetical protein BCR34DRAFT_71633 [Clohesyomyces aquaticus]|uniref:tRNA-splicing endonuclease subunit Sen2 n=1 Tax=Clohesyomyces aquaticus TaxID=1231657 RepID=A0A1Y1YZD7_9PLEO|nr:hypothetical protein BCR34DRAFT_71633 [Clohesyomyces aquaticus]
MASATVDSGTMPQQPNSTPSQNSAPQPESALNNPRHPRPRRPRYADIHAKPLPLSVYPLPVFIPQNPLSLVQIAITIISHLFFPPTSHPIIHSGHFSPETESVHVTDPEAIRALWEHGFWGKGTLSRSEPQWLEQGKLRGGNGGGKMSSEVTKSRRQDRKQFKLERARILAETIEKQLQEEGKLSVGVISDAELGKAADGNGVNEDDAADPTDDGSQGAQISDGRTPLLATAPQEDELESVISHSTAAIKDMEYLQLTPEEAFFLSYALGALQIHLPTSPQTPPSNNPKTPSSAHLLRLFGSTTTTLASCIPSLPPSLTTPIRPDTPFLLRYVAYHHFRSLGWVVRPGIKFAADWMLYNRGPVFSHAEFAVIVLPSYSNKYWEGSREREEEGRRDWWWLHRVNRVENSVFKTLVVCFVEVPRPWDDGGGGSGFGEGEIDVGDVLKRYKCREFVFRRWVAGRNR